MSTTITVEIEWDQPDDDAPDWITMDGVVTALRAHYRTVRFTTRDATGDCGQVMLRNARGDAIEEERERCALVCEVFAADVPNAHGNRYDSGASWGANECAARIRALNGEST